MTIPHRGTTTESAYFVTANVLHRKSLFHVEKIARLFIEVLMDYRTQKKYLLHEFVVMPEHLHLIITPTKIALERAMPVYQGRVLFFQLNKNLRVKKDIWQPSFFDRRIRDSLEYLEVQRLHLAESGKPLSGQDSGRFLTARQTHASIWIRYLSG